MAAATPEPTSMPTPNGEGTPAPSANDNDTAIKTKPTSSPVNTAATANDNEADFPVTSPSRPLHTQTQQTLSPTSEFMRYVLAALPSRYVLRGLFKTIFGAEAVTGKLRTRIMEWARAPGAWIEQNYFPTALAMRKTIKK